MNEKNDDDDDHAELQPWLWWNKIAQLLDYHSKVYPVLGETEKTIVCNVFRLTYFESLVELSADVPSERAQQRWLGEPVRAVILPTKIFTTNAKGFPVLSPGHQQFVIKLIKVNETNRLK